MSTAAPARTTKSASDVAVRLTALSRERAWDVYRDIAWPEALTGERYCMAPELMSVWGTEYWDTLDEAQRLRLSLYECANFFSLTLQGERPLVAGLSDRLYSKRVTKEGTEYLHHFLDEENKHMVMFGMFLNRYVGKVYPEKKVALERSYAKGEEEVMFFCKALVVEELGDYYNMKMMNDARLEPIVRELNDVHHRDESRHIAFGRLHLAELAAHWLSEWSDEVRMRVQTWLAQYLKASWADFYNPSMYRDAGLPDAFKLRTAVMAHPASAALRTQASAKLVRLFLDCGLLSEAPAL
ncbi:MAG: diiron oxygenase [Sandaracinaceae bacterium]|nr:diiron oxygenase [Sandaracinaceae bacterium]